MAALQSIWINYTIAEGHLTEAQWHDIITPCASHEYCYCMLNISDLPFKKNCDKTMKNSSGLERARILVRHACSLDLQKEIAKALKILCHRSILNRLKAVKANSVTVRQSLPNFLWWKETIRPGLRTRTWRVFHNDCFRKLPALKQAIVERGASAYSELLQVYAIGQLANIVHTVLTFEWINYRQHLRWLSKEQLADDVDALGVHPQDRQRSDSTTPRTRGQRRRRSVACRGGEAAGGSEARRLRQSPREMRNVPRPIDDGSH
jgi:hypothetical protein